MTELREFLDAQLGEHLPTGQPDFASIQQRASNRRKRRRVAAGLVATGVVAAGGVLAFQLQGAPTGSDPSKDLAGPSGSSSATPSDGRRGEVALDGSFSCVEQYSAASIPTRGFAFDGTITAIDEGSSQTDSSIAGAGYWEVTFRVHEWFVGGDGDAVVVSLPQPMPASDDRPAAYGEGTRLLVSGERATGGVDHLGWGCGFTRYYDPDTADQWRAATG